MKKITIVTRSMNSGGAERVIWYLLQYFTKNNIECHLVLMEDWHEIFYPIPEQCFVHQICCGRKHGLVHKLESYWKLRLVTKQIKPDIVLSMPEEIGIYAILALLGTKIPVVVSERNNPWVMPYKKVTRILRSLMYPYAAGLIFQTKQAASFFSEELQKKGIILPNPLDLDQLPLPYSGKRDKVVVGCGRLDKQKNFPLLIDAFSEFYKRHSDYKLVIYGEGDLRGKLECYAKSKGLPQDTIMFPGRSNRFAEELRTKAMFVLSSDYEGMPNVVIEAMAMGVPVISTDCPSGGSAELIEHGVSGLLTPVGDADALVKAMRQIAEDKEVSDLVGKNGQAVRERLCKEIVAEQWKEYLKDVCRYAED